MDVLVWGDGRVELVEEGSERRCVVAGNDLGEDLAGAHIQGGDQRGGAVVAVLELLASGLARAGGTTGVAPGAGGDRGLLVDGQHHHPFRRVAVQVAHVRDTVPEVRGVPAGEPTADPVRLEVQVGQDPTDLGAEMVTKTVPATWAAIVRCDQVASGCGAHWWRRLRSPTPHYRASKATHVFPGSSGFPGTGRRSSVQASPATSEAT